jgi:hypothetical protein
LQRSHMSRHGVLSVLWICHLFDKSVSLTKHICVSLYMPFRACPSRTVGTALTRTPFESLRLRCPCCWDTTACGASVARFLSKGCDLMQCSQCFARAQELVLGQRRFVMDCNRRKTSGCSIITYGGSGDTVILICQQLATGTALRAAACGRAVTVARAHL